MLPLLTYEFPTEGEITQEHIEDFKKHQKMAFIAARGFNVAYELIGNLRKADWYNQVSKAIFQTRKSPENYYMYNVLLFQFTFGVPFKHLKLTTTNRFGDYITDQDMTGATQACKDAYKAWCQVKNLKNYLRTILSKLLQMTFSTGQRDRVQGSREVRCGEIAGGSHLVGGAERQARRKESGKRIQVPWDRRSHGTVPQQLVQVEIRQEGPRRGTRFLAEESRRQNVEQPQQVAVQEGGQRERSERLIAELQVSASEFEIIDSDEFPLGGRLRHFISFWRKITRDPSVLRIIMGVSIPFTAQPTQSCPPRPYPMDSKTRDTVADFVSDLLATQVIVPVEKRANQFVSPFFLVTNHDGSFRGILNVKRLNVDYLQTQKFKMETLLKVLPLIREGDWFGSWDLRKGYYNVAVHPEFQRFFCFDFEGQRYMFKCLVMGISIAPFIFSKLMATLVRVARAAGIDVSFYLDDTLLRGMSYEVAWRDLRVVGQLLQLAGFLLHRVKSVYEPTQEIKYLGFIINSVTMTVRLPVEKEEKIRHALRQALRDAEQQVPWTVRQAAQLIGWLLAAIPATRYGQGHFRALENAKKWALADADNDYDAQGVVWRRSQQRELNWWLQLPTPWSRSFRTVPVTDEFTSEYLSLFKKKKRERKTYRVLSFVLQRTRLWKAGVLFITTSTSAVRGRTGTTPLTSLNS